MLQKTYTRSKKKFQTLEISCLHYNNETLPFFEFFFLPQKKLKSVVHPPSTNHINTPFVLSDLCHDVTHVGTIHRHTSPLPLEWTQHKIVQIHPFLQIRSVGMFCITKILILSTPYTRANTLYVDRGPRVTHKVCNVAPVRIGFGSGPQVI